MDLDAALDLLARDPQTPFDVAELALCLARDEYPDLDVAAYLSELGAMARLPLGQVLVRMLINLKAIYLRHNDFVRAVHVLERLRQLDPRDPIQQRDLGFSLLRAERPGQAIDHLAAYLAAVPDGEDHNVVQK